MARLILSQRLKTDPRVKALLPKERWAFIVTATVCLDDGGRLPDYPDEIISEALKTSPERFYSKPEVLRLLRRWKRLGLLRSRKGRLVVNSDVAYEEVS